MKGWTALIIMCIATAIVVYIGAFSMTANSENYYEKKFSEFGVYSHFETLNVSAEQLVAENKGLLDYLDNGQGEIQTEFFNARERQHLVEVRELYRNVYLLQTVSALVVVLSLLALVLLNGRTDTKFVKEVLSKYLIGAGIAVFGFFVLFLVMALTFSQSFILFHEVLFKTDTWMLDPATDNLINMFPEQFFFDIFVRITVVSLLVGCVFLVAGYWVRMKVKS